MPSAKDVIGTLSQKWSEDRQRVEGEFWFHEEKIPDPIREKIANFEPLAISPGFMIDGIEEGVQKGIVYTHMAVLDEEDPRCPLGECGINLRMDSKDGEGRQYRFDNKSELEAPEPPPEPEKEAVEVPEKEVPVEVVSPSVEEEPTTAPEITEPAEHKPEEVPEVVQEREPEVIIPPSKVVNNNELETDEFGFKTYVPKAYRPKEE
jgi:hypothetical protein